MSKINIKNSIFVVLFEGLKIYCSNIDKFFLYMLFPVLGQIVGIILALGLSLGLSNLVTQKIDNPLIAIACILLLALPGLLIFCKAFWDYMVAYVALNSMTEGELTTGRVYDISAHNAVATQHLGKFILLLLIVGVFNSIATSIFFMIPAFVVWIYFILIFQVYTFEQDLTIKEQLKRSFNLIKGNWFRTAVLMLILSFLTIYIATQGLTVVFDYLNLTDKLCNLIPDFTAYIPYLDEINRGLAHFELPIITGELIAKNIFYSILTFVVMGLTLPIRSICWTLWYFSLCDKNNNSKSKKSSRKKQEVEDEE